MITDGGAGGPPVLSWNFEFGGQAARPAMDV